MWYFPGAGFYCIGIVVMMMVMMMMTMIMNDDDDASLICSMNG